MVVSLRILPLQCENCIFNDEANNYIDKAIRCLCSEENLQNVYLYFQSPFLYCILKELS